VKLERETPYSVLGERKKNPVSCHDTRKKGLGRTEGGRARNGQNGAVRIPTERKSSRSAGRRARGGGRRRPQKRRTSFIKGLREREKGISLERKTLDGEGTDRPKRAEKGNATSSELGRLNKKESLFCTPRRKGNALEGGPQNFQVSTREGKLRISRGRSQKAKSNPSWGVWGVWKDLPLSIKGKRSNKKMGRGVRSLSSREGGVRIRSTFGD